MSDLKEIQREYDNPLLDLADMHSDPFVQFKYWLRDAMKVQERDYNAMILATAGTNSIPSARTVLLKNFDQNGFVFFSNYDSKKGKQIAENPFAALVFYWNKLDRQICINGKVDKTSRKESDEYFKIRPEGSKIGAWASPQSQRIPDRKYIERLQKIYYEKSQGEDINRPENWGGYRLTPNRFEFWQGRENRLHDRFEYVLSNMNWDIYRLAP